MYTSFYLIKLQQLCEVGRMNEVFTNKGNEAEWLDGLPNLTGLESDKARPIGLGFFPVLFLSMDSALGFSPNLTHHKGVGSTFFFLERPNQNTTPPENSS